MVLIFVLEMLQWLTRLSQNVLLPDEQPLAEILPLALVHEGFLVRWPITFFFKPWHAPNPDTETDPVSSLAERAYIGRARRRQQRNLLRIPRRAGDYAESP